VGFEACGLENMEENRVEGDALVGSVEENGAAGGSGPDAAKLVVGRATTVGLAGWK
jgi:hypothetical protein